MCMTVKNASQWQRKFRVYTEPLKGDLKWDYLHACSNFKVIRVFMPIFQYDITGGTLEIPEIRFYRVLPASLSVRETQYCVL